MNLATFDKLSKVLKAFAVIVAVLGIYYGVILGIFGTGADGPGAPVKWRLFGVAQLLLGVLYLVPNSKLIISRYRTYVYLGLTGSPAILILVIVALSVGGSSLHSFLTSWGLVVASTYLIACSFAPLSLIFSIVASRREKGELERG